MNAEQLRAQADAQRHREQLARWCVQWKIPAPSGPVVDAFVAKMGTKQYGVEETWDAFCWFRHGWEAVPVAPPTDKEISVYRDTFRRELDKRMDLNHRSASPSTESHAVALREFVEGRKVAKTNPA